MRSFLIALQFLTVFNLKKHLEPSKGEFASSIAWFPLVGAVQGLILVVSWYVFSAFLPEGLAMGLVILVLILTNGGLHLDGVADTIDGLAGGRTPEDRLRIMRDSSTGAIGVVAVVMTILLKYLALIEVPEEARRQVLFIFPVIGRWSIAPLAYLSPYARKEGGLGHGFSGTNPRTVVIATVMAAFLCALVLGLLSLLVMAALAGFVFVVSRFFKRRIGGVTGDVFGFQSEIVEVFFIIIYIGLSNVLSYEAF